MLHDLKLEPKIVQDGIVELGSPVGTPDFEHAFLQKSVQDILSVLPLLVEMVNDEKVRHANKIVKWLFISFVSFPLVLSISYLELILLL